VSPARLALLAGLLASAGLAQVIDVTATRPASGSSFEALWSELRKAEAAGDADLSAKLLAEIKNLRVERNVRRLDPYGLAAVVQGLEARERGEADVARQRFDTAQALDPGLPDASFAMAALAFRQGAYPSALADSLAGLRSSLATARGRAALTLTAACTALLALGLVAFVLGGVMLVRHAPLLAHDLEEHFGGVRAAPLARGLATLILLLPVVAFQGWGFLPIWWLGVLFVYLTSQERAAASIVLLLSLGCGPLVATVEARAALERNPLYGAVLRATETPGDSRTLALLEAAAAQTKDDRDLQYLVASSYKKADRYDEAAARYQAMLQADPADLVALNNLGNIDYARQEYAAALARYRQGIEQNPGRTVAATLHYNLSLAQYQKFEYEPAKDSRAQADRLSAELTRGYDALWRRDKGDPAAVDLGLDPALVEAKFRGAREGVARKNMVGKEPAGLPDGGGFSPEQLLNRVTVMVVLAGLAFGALSRWRGERAFTARCNKCGTPFCRRCHLGASPAGLCSQCHHLFVIRDGVSGPARNQKLTEVQEEEVRRERIFRGLSVAAPGAGQIYGRRPLAGLLLLAIWAACLAWAFVSLRVLSLTDVASSMARPWGLWIAGLAALLTYLFAQRLGPAFEAEAMPRRAAPRRPAPAGRS
jgi:tetratricopeptide (TPR) repeat protein